MTTRRQKTLQKAKEIKDKLKKLNPSLYNRSKTTRLTKAKLAAERREKAKDKLKAVLGGIGKKKPNKGGLNVVPGGPWNPKDKKDPVPGGPWKPEKGPKYMTPMTNMTKSLIKRKEARKKSLAGAPTPKKYNLGGEAATSVGRATVRKSQTAAQRKRVDEMLKRLYGPTIKPKKKPKKPADTRTKTRIQKIRQDALDPRKYPIRPSLKKRLADQAKRRK